MKSSLTHHSWTLIEPTHESNAHPRAAIYVNNSIISASSYETIYIPSSDATAISIKLQNSEPMLLINIYNAKNSNLIAEICPYIRNHLLTNRYGLVLIGGDFNLHHPLWNPQVCHTQDYKAEELIEFMALLGLSPMLPAGTITFPRANMAIDLVWGNNRLEQGIIKCKISKKDDYGSDYLPIQTIVNLQPHRYEVSYQPYNYDKTN